MRSPCSTRAQLQGGTVYNLAGGAHGFAAGVQGRGLAGGWQGLHFCWLWSHGPCFGTELTFRQEPGQSTVLQSLKI